MEQEPYTYEELKELTKQLFVVVQTVYGMTFTDLENKPKHQLKATIDKIHRIAGEAYNLNATANKKGLWK